jgi:hypothetical protein
MPQNRNQIKIDDPDEAEEQSEDRDDQLARDEHLAEHATRRLKLIVDHPRLPRSEIDALAGNIAGPDIDGLNDSEARSMLLGAAVARRPLVDAALQLLGARALWSALRVLDPQTQPQPTARIELMIAQREVALGWLSYVATTCGTDDAFEIASRDVTRIPVLDAASGLAMIAELEIRNLRAERDARLDDRDQLTAAGRRTGDRDRALRGERGPLAGPALLLQLIERLAPLLAARWPLTQVAELVLDSQTWREPPCPNYVTEVLDAAGGVREDAIDRLAERIRVAKRRDPSRPARTRR